jgi:hypothetical protein
MHTGHAKLGLPYLVNQLQPRIPILVDVAVGLRRKLKTREKLICFCAGDARTSYEVLGVAEECGCEFFGGRVGNGGREHDAISATSGQSGIMTRGNTLELESLICRSQVS